MMGRFSGFRAAQRRLRPLVLLASAGLLALCCSKRMTGLNELPDPSRYPEGRRGNADLVVYLDTPSIGLVFEDNAGGEVDSVGKLTDDDPLDRTESFSLAPSGAMQGMILDSTNADRFEVYRREGAGFLTLRDFTFRPVKLFLQTHWEGYQFTDSKPVASTSRQYLGRGVVAGVANGNSPLTNVGQVPVGPVASDLLFTAKTGSEPSCLNCARELNPEECRRTNGCPDSLLYMEWQAVPGATGYWLQVYQLAPSLSGDGIVASGLPAPLYLGLSVDYFVAYVPDATAPPPSGHPDRRSYRIGDPLPAGGHLLFRNPLFNNQTYTVRVSAVGASGELLAYTGDGARGPSGSQPSFIRGSGIFRVFTVIENGAIFFRAFPLGGVAIQPKSQELPPPLATAGSPGTAAPRMFSIEPPGALPLGRRR